MVHIKNFKAVHEEFHKELLRRKHPVKFWGSPFENALATYSLINHKIKDEPLIKELIQWLNNWISNSSLDEPREIASAGLYAYTLKELKKDNTQINEKVTAVLARLANKEETKFSIFNNPELFFCSTLCLELDNVEDEKLKEKISTTLYREISNKWLNKIVRFVFYNASFFELKKDTNNSVINKINNFLMTYDISTIDHYELICLLWFLGRYKRYLLQNSGENTILNSILERFDNLKTHFSFKPNESEEGLTYVTTTQLILLDDALNSLTKEFKIDPMDILNLLDIHPEIKKVSKELFKNGHYAEAIFESFKKINTLVKEKADRPKKNGRELDGKNLMMTVFNIQNPILKLNNLSTDIEKDEQEGFMHIFGGATQGIRNPKAHDNIKQKDPNKTLEYLMFASLLARKIDEARRN